LLNLALNYDATTQIMTPFATGPAAMPKVKHHFTGKERDTESGNDYFGARYYASSMGRFMSPDWSKTPTAVPYAKLYDPQSLNLYLYGANNPLRFTDADGHCWQWAQSICNTFNQAVNYVANTAYFKAEGGIGLGIKIKAGPFEPKIGIKDTIETKVAKEGTKKEIKQATASTDIGPVAVGVEK
jgi:RHS repeat-associated protein